VDLQGASACTAGRYTDLCIDAFLRIRHYAAVQKGLED
jgi:hypothetical protein